jgi:Cd2+/Zn2+-exporting ATPase
MPCCDTNQSDHEAPAALPRGAPDAGVETAVFLIQKMDCPTEEKLIRDHFKGMAGIDAMQFNLMARELTVQHRLSSTQPIVSGLKKLDLAPLVKSDSLRTAADLDPGVEPADLSGDYRISPFKWTLMAISGVTAIGAEVVAWTTGAEGSWPVIALALVAIATGGMDTLKKGWIALRHFSLNMNFLMSLAVIGAALIGQWPEAAVVIFLFAAAEMIEALSLDRARNAIKGLMALTPDMATVQGEGEGDHWRAMPAIEVKPGAIVRVKPGERVPLDGVLLAGQTSINQAPITGESMPVEKQPGDTVFAGTINERGAFDCRVTAVQADSTLSRIIKSVQQAQGERAPTQRFVDQFALYYIPAVVAMALIVGFVVPLVLQADFQPWLYKALVLLVIACPCALVISTPVTVVSGLAAGARRGILIKGGVYLEQGRKLKALALDKTGTITLGQPSVTDVEVVAVVDVGDQAMWMRFAASLSNRSDHPVSTAVVAHWNGLGLHVPLFDVQDVEALAGRGVKGSIDGATFYLGNHRLIHELGICGPDLEARLEQLEAEGKTVVLLSSATAPLMIVAVADTIRASSAAAIARIQAMNVHVIMLTGDNPHTAQAIAAKVGIADARGNLLPSDKLAAINNLVVTHGYVGMVGDGINDAPALAKADIGFAMGAAGTDTALETADVALMDDDLGKLAEFLALSRRTSAILMQNIVLALGIKAVFLVLALTGQATLWMAVFADMGASLLVVANGLRLLRPAAMRSCVAPSAAVEADKPDKQI